jgi:DHA2 family multidrug resistance protein
MIYGTVQRQAAMLAFIDDFKMLGVIFLAVLPVLLLLKKPSRQAGSAPVH